MEHNRIELQSLIRDLGARAGEPASLSAKVSPPEDIRVIARGRFLFQCIKHLHPAALLLPQLADASFISGLLSFLDFALKSAEPSVGRQSLQRT